MDYDRMKASEPVEQSLGKGHLGAFLGRFDHHLVHILVHLLGTHLACGCGLPLFRGSGLLGSKLLLLPMLLVGARRNGDRNQEQRAKDHRNRSPDDAGRHHLPPAADDQWMWAIFHPAAVRRRTMVSTVRRLTGLPLYVPVVLPSVAIQAIAPTA
jgi:hypothetical protein